MSTCGSFITKKYGVIVSNSVFFSYYSFFDSIFRFNLNIDTIVSMYIWNRYHGVYEFVLIGPHGLSINYGSFNIDHFIKTKQYCCRLLYNTTHNMIEYSHNYAAHIDLENGLLQFSSLTKYAHFCGIDPRTIDIPSSFIDIELVHIHSKEFMHNNAPFTLEYIDKNIDSISVYADMNRVYDIDYFPKPNYKIIDELRDIDLLAMVKEKSTELHI